MRISNCQLCGEEKRTGDNHQCNLTKLKPLSQLLAEVEPKCGFGDSLGNNMVDRASYDKLKAIAVELAKACEDIGLDDMLLDRNPDKARSAITNARKMLGDNE